MEDICLDMEYMLNVKVSAYWRICWAILTPVLLIIILVYSLATMETLTYGHASYPSSAIGNYQFYLTEQIFRKY